MNVYLTSLSSFLKGYYVIALDATNSLDDPARLWQGWIKRKADLFGFRAEDAGKPFSRQSAAENNSVHLYHHRSGGLIRAYYLTRGTIKADGPL